MVKLYGKSWKRCDLSSRVGRLEQLGGIRRIQQKEGVSAGVDQVWIRTGAGLSYVINLSKGMDISLAEFCGVPISWQSPNDDVHPAFYNDEGLEWLRTASGGLLMTCGLRQVGMVNVDEGESLGLHGRIHHTPAHQIAAEGKWIDDNYVMTVRGVLEETRMFGERLILRREIKSVLGENRIILRDTVENAGFKPSPLMILYHFNFGFPLLMEETEIEFPSQTVTPRDADYSAETHGRWEAPQSGIDEQVFWHTDIIAKEGWATAKIKNPSFPLPFGPVPLEAHLTWKVDTLDKLTQWKMPGEGMHVLGIEPGNCYTEGRAAEREKMSLVFLEPGESRDYEIQMNLITPDNYLHHEK